MNEEKLAGTSTEHVISKIFQANFAFLTDKKT
jgi:hypothetical protein